MCLLVEIIVLFVMKKIKMSFLAEKENMLSILLKKITNRVTTKVLRH